MFAIKSDWKRRANPKLVAVIVVPLVVVAVWWAVSRMGASFGGVLQADLSQVASITMKSPSGTTHYTERAGIEAIVKHLRDFRYTSSAHVSDLDSITMIWFEDESGAVLNHLALIRGAVLLDGKLYLGDETYFDEWLD